MIYIGLNIYLFFDFIYKFLAIWGSQLFFLLSFFFQLERVHVAGFFYEDFFIKDLMKNLDCNQIMNFINLEIRREVKNINMYYTTMLLVL